MTGRMKQILRFLLEENQSVSINVLSEKIGVSKRTIQRELPYVQKELKPYDLIFMSKTGTGVWIEGDEDNKQRLLSLLKGQKSVDVSDRDYRRKMITLELLKEKDLKKLYWYSNKFQVSEATISTDIEAIEPWFHQYNIKITRKPGSGISTSGEESDFRKAIKAFIGENIGDINIIYNSTSSNIDLFEKVENFDIKQMLDDKILNRVIMAVDGVDDNYISTLTDYSYTALIIHICVAITRILKDETIHDKDEFIQEVAQTSEFSLAKKIAFELEEEFEIELPEVEIAHICLHLNASKHEKIEASSHGKSFVDGEALYNIINDMIYAFDKEIAYALKQDIEFLEGLISHLQPTLVRLNYDMAIHNPMEKTIEQEYSEIFDKCKNVAKVIENFVHKPIPKSEIAFLTVHFCAAIVRIEEKRTHTREVNIGVVCASGIGISRLMASKLKKVFKNKINLSTYSKNELTGDSIKHQDFLVSSIPLTFKDIEIVKVNPLLNDKDIENIGKLITKYQYKEKKAQSSTTDFDEIYRCATLIKNLIDDITFIKLENHLNFEEVLAEISANITSSQNDREIITNDISNREKISTQIFPELGFALLHAQSNGVNKPCFKISIPKSSLSFTDDYFSNINIIFTMLIPKDENLQINSEILGSISSSIVDDEELISNILKQDEVATIKHISNTLKKFLLSISNDS